MIIYAIRNLRKSKNITLDTLSNKTSISNSYLSKLENNKVTNCTINTLEKIADALEVNIKDLFYSKLDINELKIKLNETIDEYGINSKEALEISQLVDLVINVINKDNEN